MGIIGIILGICGILVPLVVCIWKRRVRRIARRGGQPTQDQENHAGDSLGITFNNDRRIPTSNLELGTISGGVIESSTNEYLSPSPDRSVEIRAARTDTTGTAARNRDRWELYPPPNAHVRVGTREDDHSDCVLGGDQAEPGRRVDPDANGPVGNDDRRCTEGPRAR